MFIHDVRFAAKLLGVLGVCCWLWPSQPAVAGLAYGDPDGGWVYTYDGSQDASDESAALDGDWDHSQNDHWDGSAPGDEDSAPGGIGSFTEGDVTYLRVQDSGDPRDLGFEDAISNRKMSLNRNLVDLDGISEAFLDDGFTFTMRTRLATTGPLDVLTFGGSEDEWPEAGRGYDIDFNGTGFFTLNQKFGNNPGPLSFSLADPEFGLEDVGGGDVGGLLMNNLVADFPAGEVDTHEHSMLTN